MFSWWSLLCSNIFYSVQWGTYWTAKARIRECGCAVWSGPLISTYAPKIHFGHDMDLFTVFFHIWLMYLSFIINLFFYIFRLHISQFCYRRCLLYLLLISHFYHRLPFFTFPSCMSILSYIFSFLLLGWLGEAKVSFILCHRGIQLRLAYSWARPAILAAGKGRGRMFSFPLFLHFHSFSSFSPVPFFHLLNYFYSPFLWEATQNDQQRMTCR